MRHHGAKEAQVERSQDNATRVKDGDTGQVIVQANAKGTRGKSGKDVSEVTTEKSEEHEQVTKELGGIELGGKLSEQTGNMMQSPPGI